MSLSTSTTDPSLYTHLYALNTTDGINNIRITAVQNKHNKKVFVCKCVTRHQARGEADILRLLSPHPHIMQFYGHAVQPDGVSCNFYLEYGDRGTLRDVVNRYTDLEASVPEAFIWDVLESLSSAILWLHEGKMGLPEDDPHQSEGRDNRAVKRWDPILHNDISTANVFLTSLPFRDPSDPSVLAHRNSGLPSIYPRVILGDFGAAEELSKAPYRRARWMPDARHLDYKSLHYTIWALALGTEPLDGAYTDELKEMLDKRTIPDRGEAPDAESLLRRVRALRRRAADVIPKDEVLLMLDGPMAQGVGGEVKEVV